MKHFLHSPKFVLPLLAVVIFFARLHTYYEPIEQDVGTYATVANEMLQGKELYKDLGDQKPPAIHITYAAAELIAGRGRAAIFLLTVCASISTLCAVYFAGLTFGRGAALWAALFWTVISGDLGLQANQPNTEVFINSFLTWGLVVLLNERREWSPWAAGVCFAAAALYKQSIVVTPALLCAATLLWPRPPLTRRQALADVVIIASVGFFALGAVIGYFAWNGNLADFKHWVVDFNQDYAGSIAENLLRSLERRFLFPTILWFSIPLLVGTLAGFAQAVRGKNWHPWLMLLALGVATQITVALPGRFFPHYYQLWLPFMSIGAAWGFAAVGQQLKAPHQWFARLAAPVAVFCLLAVQAPNYFKSPTQWSVKKYGTIFVETELLAEMVNERLKPGETIYQLGTQPQLYLLTHRPASRVLTASGWMIGPKIADESQRVINEFQAHPPDLVILQASMAPGSPSHPLWRWFQEWFARHYEPAGLSQTWARFNYRVHFILFLRKGSDLQKRWPAMEESSGRVATR